MYFCINILFQLLLFYNYILLGGIILSWIPGLYNFKFFRLIRKLSDLYMEPFSGYILLGPFDFTPIIGFMLYDGLIYAISYLI